jgi:hypothetical protein
MPDVLDLLREAVGSYRPRGDERTVERRLERRVRRQRVTAGVVGLGLMVAVAALGWALLRPTSEIPGSSPTPSIGSTSTPTPTPSTEPGTLPRGSVPLGEVPDRGVAVASERAVELVGLDGSVVATLPGYTIAGNPGASGVWLEWNGRLYSLDLEARALIPVSSPGSSITDEGPPPELAAPPGDPVGGWRYTIEGPTATLAQWSGDCEVPTAFWVTGSETVIVTGEAALAEAPASLALGWSEDGGAIALVTDDECGGTTDRPGIYVFSSPGNGRLIHPTSDSALLADAWGTGLG